MTNEISCCIFWVILLYLIWSHLYFLGYIVDYRGMVFKTPVGWLGGTQHTGDDQNPWQSLLTPSSNLGAGYNKDVKRRIWGYAGIGKWECDVTNNMTCGCVWEWRTPQNCKIGMVSEQERGLKFDLVWSLEPLFLVQHRRPNDCCNCHVLNKCDYTVIPM
jgi:hypothetical protein